LVDGIRVKLFVSKDSFESNSLLSFFWGFEPEGISYFFYFEELVTTLFSEFESDFCWFFIPN
jgi:hypothetical protein